MDISVNAFTYIISLAAVVNGLGIVHLLRGFSGLLRVQGRISITHYWVFNLWAALQFLLHILLWWSMWGVREVGAFTFLSYLYLLTGPIILYLCTSLLIPEPGEGAIDLRAQYQVIRKSYFTTMALFWFWAILLWPIIGGVIPPTAPFFLVNLVITLILRSTANTRIHAVLTITTYIVIAIYIGVYAMQLGAVGSDLMPGRQDA